MADEIQSKLKTRSDEYVKEILTLQTWHVPNWKLTLKCDLEVMTALWKHWFNAQ